MVRPPYVVALVAALVLAGTGLALTASSRDAATITSGASTTPMMPFLSDGKDWTRGSYT